MDVNRRLESNTSNRTRVVQFYLANEKNASLSEVNWTAEFGDGNLVRSSEPFNLSKGENVLTIVEHKYNSGGHYKVNLSGIAGDSLDFEPMRVVFGALANHLGVLDKNASTVVTEFSPANSLSVESVNWSWDCTNGISSDQDFNMSPGQDVLVVIEHVYSGDVNLSCAVRSADGNQSASAIIALDGLKITDYNSSMPDADTLRVQFSVTNSFSALDADWNITVDDMVLESGSPIALVQGETASVTRDINLTRGGYKRVTVTIESGNLTDSYTEYHDVQWLTLNEFYSTVKNATARVFDFLVRNDNLGNATSTWNMSDPSLQNATNLVGNESLIVVIEEDYGQGQKDVQVKVFNGTVQDDSLLDIFTIKHIEIEKFDTLHQSDKRVVTSSTIKNNVENATVSWQLNNSQDVIFSSLPLNLTTGEDVIVIVDSYYDDSGVYPLNFEINSSDLNDNATGVAIS